MVSLSRKVVRPKLGKRADLGGQFVRSAMEADTARVLQVLAAWGAIGGWCFEPTTFLFAGKLGSNGREYGTGPFRYTPDFLIWHHSALSGQKLDRRNLWRDCVEGGVSSVIAPPDFGAAAGARWHGAIPPPGDIVGEYVEVKGSEQGSDRSKRKRMAKHYPDVSVSQVGPGEFAALATVFAGSIRMWESKIRSPRRRRKGL